MNYHSDEGKNKPEMSNPCNQIHKSKSIRIISFVGLFSVAFLIFCPFLKRHYGIDTYLFKVGILSSAKHYELGRFLTGAIWDMLISIGIDPVGYQSVFTFLSIGLLSFAAYRLLQLFSALRTDWNVESFLVLCLSIMISMYQAFILGWFIYPEVIFFMMMALVLSISAVVSLIQEPSWKGGIMSYVYMSSALAFYQGAGPFFIVFAILYAVIKKTMQAKTRILNRISLVWLIYVLAGLTNIVLIKAGATGRGRTNFGELNYFERVFKIIDSLQKKLQYTHLGATPVYVFLGVMIILILIAVVSMKKSRLLTKQSIFLLLTFFVSSFLSIMAPHFMTRGVDISPRSIAALMSLPGATCIFILMQVRTFRESIHYYFVSACLLFFLLINAIIVNSVATSRVATNLMDKELAKIIYERIVTYEKRTGTIVTHIAFSHDDKPTLCYQGLNCYGNIRAMGYDKGVIPLIDIASGRKFSMADMPASIYNSYFKAKDFDAFDEKQVILQGNTLYLLLY